MRDLVIGALGLVLGGLVIFIAKLPVGRITEVVIANPAAGVAAIAALFAFISGVLGPLVQWRVGKRQALASQTSASAAMLAARTVGAREIAKLRMAWMEKLRDTLSEYHAILMSTKESSDSSSLLSDEDERKLSQLGTQIDLLLNQKDVKQKALWDVADKILALETRAERQALDSQLVEAARDVLKEEWEKVKREMEGEKFQTGETTLGLGV